MALLEGEASSISAASLSQLSQGRAALEESLRASSQLNRSRDSHLCVGVFDPARPLLSRPPNFVQAMRPRLSPRQAREPKKAREL